MTVNNARAVEFDTEPEGREKGRSLYEKKYPAMVALWRQTHLIRGKEVLKKENSRQRSGNKEKVPTST